jgi:acetylglutamate kinase
MRVTDESSMKVVEMVLTGSVSTDVVTRTHQFVGQGIGISGKDGRLLGAKKLQVDGRDLGMVGEITEVRRAVIDTLLGEGYLPVISPIGVDAHGATFNINADNVAAEVAIAFGAYKILYLTDVPGVRNGDVVMSQSTPEGMEMLIDSGVIQGGMIPKVTSLLHALKGGAASGHIVDGRVPHNLLAELFTDKGVGTWVRSSTSPAS